MFKIKGSCEIKIVNSQTGKTKEVIEKENLITDNTLLDVLGWIPNNLFSTSTVLNIFISANASSPNSVASGVSIMATAYTPSDVTKITFYPNANPIYGQIQQRIDYVGTDRTFQTVGIRNSSSGKIFAYLLLDTPCTQGAYDYLDLFYRVQFINAGGQGLATTDALLDFARGCFLGGSNSFDMQYYSPWCGVASSMRYARYATAKTLLDYKSNILNSSHSVSSQTVASHYKFKMNISFDQDQSIGFIFGSLLQGSASSGGYHTIKNIQNPLAPFQNIFTHSSNATVPFFNSLTSAAGNGKIRTSGNWTGKFPELYKITIVQGGATGVATYKYSVRKHLGFNGNSYSDLAFNSPYRIDLPGFHGMKEENNDLLRWSNTQIVQYDQTGIMLLDVFDGRYQIWDAASTPNLPATQIRQCAVDPINQKIYVACRATGLWVINVSTNTIERPFNIPCYGVDVGRNNVAYVVIEGGMYLSSNWNTPLVFTYTGITDNNWSKVYFLKCDPEHISDRIAMAIAVPSASNRVVWWNVGGSVVNGPQSSSIKAYPASLEVSDTGSHWVSGAGRLTFGSASLGSLGGSLITGGTLNHSIYGSDTYYKITFYNQYLILADRIVDIAGITINTFTSFSSGTGRSAILHLDSGICILSNFLRQMFSDNFYCWNSFGWNGSQWVLNHTGAKTTHTDNQLLGNGINIRFENGTNAPHFIGTDFYTQSICEGKHKDNASTISHNTCWYSVGAIFNKQVASGATIPVASPYTITLSAASETDFRRIETDSPELHKFTINGSPVTTVYTNGQAPAPNEVTINAAGVITFNASDAGKVFSGTFAILLL